MSRMVIGIFARPPPWGRKFTSAEDGTLLASFLLGSDFFTSFQVRDGYLPSLSPGAGVLHLQVLDV